MYKPDIKHLLLYSVQCVYKITSDRRKKVDIPKRKKNEQNGIEIGKSNPQNK